MSVESSQRFLSSGVETRRLIRSRPTGHSWPAARQGNDSIRQGHQPLLSHVHVQQLFHSAQRPNSAWTSLQQQRADTRFNSNDTGTTSSRQTLNNDNCHRITLQTLNNDNCHRITLIFQQLPVARRGAGLADWQRQTTRGKIAREEKEAKPKEERSSGDRAARCEEVFEPFHCYRVAVRQRPVVTVHHQPARFLLFWTCPLNGGQPRAVSGSASVSASLFSLHFHDALKSEGIAFPSTRPSAALRLRDAICLHGYGSEWRQVVTYCTASVSPAPASCALLPAAAQPGSHFHTLSPAARHTAAGPHAPRQAPPLSRSPQTCCKSVALSPFSWRRSGGGLEGQTALPSIGAEGKLRSISASAGRGKRQRQRQRQRQKQRQTDRDHGNGKPRPENVSMFNIHRQTTDHRRHALSRDSYWKSVCQCLQNAFFLASLTDDIASHSNMQLFPSPFSRHPRDKSDSPFTQHCVKAADKEGQSPHINRGETTAVVQTPKGGESLLSLDCIRVIYILTAAIHQNGILKIQCACYRKWQVEWEAEAGMMVSMFDMPPENAMPWTCLPRMQCPGHASRECNALDMPPENAMPWTCLPRMQCPGHASRECNALDMPPENAMPWTCLPRMQCPGHASRECNASREWTCLPRMQCPGHASREGNVLDIPPEMQCPRQASRECNVLDIPPENAVSWTSLRRMQCWDAVSWTSLRRCNVQDRHPENVVSWTSLPRMQCPGHPSGECNVQDRPPENVMSWTSLRRMQCPRQASRECNVLDRPS